MSFRVKPLIINAKRCEFSIKVNLSLSTLFLTKARWVILTTLLQRPWKNQLSYPFYGKGGY